MRRYLPELIALPLLPLLMAQGKRARRRIPRLPEAAGPAQGIAPGQASLKEQPLTLLALGESPVAGVGVSTHEEAITASLARALAQRLGRPVAWEAWGINGITAAQARTQLVPRLPRRPVDIALVAFGVNDSTAFRSVNAWTSDMLGLLTDLQDSCSPSLVLLAGVPPLSCFPALPRPLRNILGLKAAALDRALRDLTARQPHVRHVPTALDPRSSALMASDGYHPSAAGCAAWATGLAQAGLDHLSRQPLPLGCEPAGSTGDSSRRRTPG